MSSIRDLHQKWMQQEDYRIAYAELEPGFALSQAMIAARVAAGLSQEQLAQRMQTTQSVIERLEGGESQPSTQTLNRLAAATGTKLTIRFEPTA